MYTQTRNEISPFGEPMQPTFPDRNICFGCVHNMTGGCTRPYNEYYCVRKKTEPSPFGEPIDGPRHPHPNPLGYNYFE